MRISSSPSRTRRNSEPSSYASSTAATARPLNSHSTSIQTSFPLVHPQVRKPSSPVPFRRSTSKLTPTSPESLSPARQIRQSVKKPPQWSTPERQPSQEQKEVWSRTGPPPTTSTGRHEHKSTRFADIPDTIHYRNSDTVGDLWANHSHPTPSWQSKTQLNETSSNISFARSSVIPSTSPVHSQANSPSVSLLPNKSNFTHTPMTRYVSSEIESLTKRLEVSGIKSTSASSSLKDVSRYSPMLSRRTLGPSSSAHSTQSMAVSSESDVGRHSILHCRNGLVGLRNLGNTVRFIGIYIGELGSFHLYP